MKKIRILLADDHVLFIQSLKIVIERKEPDFEVVALVTNGNDAVEAVSRYSPDLVLMDISMPGLDGVTATGVIHLKHPESKVIILTNYDDDQFVLQALRNGACGYLLKDIPVDQLLAALKSLLGGIVPTSQIVMDNLARILQKNVLSLEPERTLKNRPQGIPEWYDRLTRKERDILRLLLEGAENKSIAAELHLGEQTIKNYLSIIYSKIGVHDRNGAIRIAQLVKQYL